MPVYREEIYDLIKKENAAAADASPAALEALEVKKR